MTNREFFIKCWSAEQPAFLRVLRALPQEQLDYKPHEKNASARDLAWLLALENEHLVKLLEEGKVEFFVEPCPATIGEIAGRYERNADALKERLGRTDDARWEGPGKFLYQGQVVMDGTAGDICWSFFFDGIHHRGQLTAYLRPMGGKVPSVYGPSADDPGTT